MNSIVEQEVWDKHWEQHVVRYDEARIPFKEIFSQIRRPVRNCFEIGCYPGNFLLYLGRKFDCEINGIDLTPHVDDRMVEHLKSSGLRVGKVTRGDFFEMPPGEQYDLVCSFGFVEHFQNYQEVLEKHVALVAPGGTLFVSCPNFRGIQYLLHKALDAPNLRIHVLKAMNLKAWVRLLRSHGLEIQSAGYYQTADFWADSPGNGLQYRLRRWTKRLADMVNRRIHFPNRLTSPYLYVCARKP